MVTLAANTTFIKSNSNGVKNSIDPAGVFGSANLFSSNAIPIVTLSTANHQRLNQLQTYVAVFTSTVAGSWKIAGAPDEAVMVISQDSLLCTISWTIPVTAKNRPYYIGATCRSNGANQTSTAWSIVHVGPGNTLFVGPSDTYANLKDAFAAMSGGDHIVIRDGTYTDDYNLISYDNPALPGLQYDSRMPKPGTYTDDNNGVDTLYTITNYSAVCAETPGGVILDGQDTKNPCYLYGSTERESDTQAQFGRGWPLLPEYFPNGARRGIVFLGITACNALGNVMNFYFVDHIILDYCIAFSGGRNATGTKNVTGINFNSSKDCLVENTASFGHNRYKIFDFLSKRIVKRRCIARTDDYSGSEPISTYMSYHGRNVLTANVLDVDSDLAEFWTSTDPSIIAGSFGVADTNVWNYAADIHYFGVGALNTAMGVIRQDSYLKGSSYTGFHLEHACVFNIDYSAVPTTAAVVRGNPLIVDNLTLYNVEIAASRAFYDGGTSQKTSNSIIDTITATTGKFAYNAGALMEFNDTWLWNLTDNWDIAAPAYTNVTEDTDPKLNGLKYFGRLENNSALSVADIGCNKFWKTIGKSGTLYGETDYDTVYNMDWLNRLNLTVIQSLMKAYSVSNAPTRSLGPQNYSGNRGWCADGENLAEYLNSALGNTIYPHYVNSYVEGGKLVINWEGVAANYRVNLTKVIIKLDGQTAQDNITIDKHRAEFSGLAANHAYQVELHFYNAITGESGPSLTKSVTIN